MRRRITKILQTVVLILVFNSFIQLISLAEEKSEVKDRTSEIVFLLDASGSMKSQDRERLALDAIRQAAHSLPSDYRVGFVAYSTDVMGVIPLETNMEILDAQLNEVQYGGFTNAGAGLTEAMNLFSEDTGINRYVIMLSDGEIDMPNRDSEKLSRDLYSQAITQARERGVKICIIAVGSELNDPQLHIFDGAEMTDGAIYWEGQSGSLTQIMDRIVADRLESPRQPVGVTDAGGGNVRVEVPHGAARLKLMITSEKGINEVSGNYAAESGKTITGKKFAVLDMDRPSTETVDLYFKTSDIAGVKAFLITEFTVIPRLTVTYRSEEIPRTEEEVKKNVPPEYEHFADIIIELADIGGKNENLWQAIEYDGVEIQYSLNGVLTSGNIKEGQIITSIPAEGIDTVEVTINPEGMNGVYYIKQPVSEEIKKYPDPEFLPEPDYRPLYGILGVLTAAIIIILIFWLKKKNTTVIYVAQPPASTEPIKKMETKTCTYSGKFNMYVVRTGDGRDIPPQTYRLFGRNSGRMTLNQILTACKIKLGKIGAEDIVFYPGPDHSVIIMDQSERCTALRGTEILKKGMGYPVFYGEKITITFEDEATEMEIHYKNLKPSEREGQQ